MVGSGTGVGVPPPRTHPSVQINDVSCPSICTWLPAIVPVSAQRGKLEVGERGRVGREQRAAKDRGLEILQGQADVE